MANIILINPSSRSHVGTTSVALTVPPLGLAYLAAVLRLKKHKVQIIDANVLNYTDEELINKFVFSPDIIGMSVNILTYKAALRSVKAVKLKYPEVLAVLGGPHASTLAEHILRENPFIDFVVKGEGEETFPALATVLDNQEALDKVKGIVYRNNGSIRTNEERPLIQDLNCLPMPAYDLLPSLSFYKTRSRKSPVGYILTSRGCPARCTYCYRSFGDKWREFSPRKVVEEIVYLKETYDVKQIDIMDDNFTFNIDRASQILDMIIEKDLKIMFNLQIGIRVDRVNEELLAKMKKAGVFKMGFGVESGDEAILKKIKKGIRLSKAEALVKTARKLGIITHGYFMIGFPFDTYESINRTIDFAVKLNPHYASFSLFTPLPGTELYDYLYERDQLIEDIRNGIDHGLFSSKLIFKGENLSQEEVVHYFKSAWTRFYKRPSKIWEVMTSVRSKGELEWMFRIVADMLRTQKDTK